MLATFSLSSSVFAQAGEIRIVHIHSMTGPQEDLGRQTRLGLQIGLDYATNGTRMLHGKKIVLIEKDDQGKPDVGKALLAAAYSDDKADIAIGPTMSNVALAMLPVAEEYKKVLIVEPAVADSITGDKWNRYIFRTGRNSTQDAVANAAAIDGPGVSIATLAQDYAFGKDGVRALKAAIKKGTVVHEEYAPPTTSDFTASAQRIIDKLKDRPGRKVIWILWSGAGNPYKIIDMDLKRYGIEVASFGNTFAAMAAYKNLPGMQGASTYYFGLPQNKVNDYLVAEHQKRHGIPPDTFTAGGFSAGVAAVTALRKTGGETGSAKLIEAMEGMSFESPKGTMTFRKEDHQAMQSMYHFKIKVDPALAWGVPELVKEIKPEEMAIPVANKR
ncbi:substrate-binding domain-containing protein [Ottowia thiooxydans]|uniref:substrate-binding domain-containing protein n=1 Tax=Ottowia thiooxydans TaxID=219182 RepID=UPI003CCBCB99